MMRVELNELEVRVLNYRKCEVPYKEIAQRLGMSSYQRAQYVYRTALNKIRTFNRIRDNDPQLVKAAEKNGCDSTQLLRLFHVLEKNRIEDSYKTLSHSNLIETPGIGAQYIKILEDSIRFSTIH